MAGRNVTARALRIELLPTCLGNRKALLERTPPLFMLAVPIDCQLHTLFKIDFWLPTQLAPDLAAIQEVTSIVAWPIGHIGFEAFGLTKLSQNPVGDLFDALFDPLPML